MSAKLDAFKQRAAVHGQTLSVSAFVAWPTGTYVDDWSGEPDPDSATYPATVPGPTFATARTVNGFLQTNGKFREQYVRAPWGKDVQVDAVAYLPGDESVGLLDKITYAGGDYYVIMLADWRQRDDRIHWEVKLSRKIEYGG